MILIVQSISVAKINLRKLLENYNELKFEEILDLGEKILQFLSEIEAGEEAVNYINDYIHYRVMYQSNGSERKLSGIVFISDLMVVKLKITTQINL